MSDRLVLIVTSPRLPAGLLSWPAWQALRAGPVVTGAAGHPQEEHLRAVGVDVTVLPGPDDRSQAIAFRALLDDAGSAVWLAAADGDPDFVQALSEVVAAEPEPRPELEVVVGSHDPPGAALLDVVAVMDRLRSPGGCPWDAEQTHDSLGRYLLEEAYEAYEAIEQGDLGALREELGDVLLQVVFHARLAAELPPGSGWDVDDVAGDLVDKLVRRHPHVFGDVSVTGVEQVVVDWQQIKATEKQRMSVTDGVPMGQPALALAAKLQRRAANVGLPAELVSEHLAAARNTAAAVAAAAAGLVDQDVPPSVDRVGELLFAAVALARDAEVDPEAALRGTARRFRDRLAEVERVVRASGGDPAALDAAGWHGRWAAAAPVDPADDDGQGREA